MTDASGFREALAAEVVREFAGAVDKVRHQRFGHASLTFEVRAGRRSYIVKTSDQPSAFEHTLRTSEVLAGLGVPVPQRMRRGCRDGIEWLMYEKLPGRDLRYQLAGMSAEQGSRLADQIVSIQRAIGSLPAGRGYGWTPLGTTGPFASWYDVVARDSENAPPEVKAKVRAIEPYLREHPPTCFLDDITVKNVIVHRGELRGIVDLDFVCYGDPMYWLSLTETTVVLDVGFEALSYTREIRQLWELTPQEERANAIYGAIHACYFLDRAKRPARGAQRERMQAWLDLCLGTRA